MANTFSQRSIVAHATGSFFPSFTVGFTHGYSQASLCGEEENHPGLQPPAAVLA